MGLGFFIKGTFSFCLLFSLVADSVVTSSSSVLYHFKHSQSYPYLAAYNGEQQASFWVYQQTNDNNYLKLAAEQGNGQAAYLWYQLDKLKRQVWLSFAVNKQHPEAILEQLLIFKQNKQWQQASNLLDKLDEVRIGRWPEPIVSQLNELTELVELALAPADIDLIGSDKFELQSGLLVNAEPNSCRMTIQFATHLTHLLPRAERFEQALSHYGLAELPICCTQRRPDVSKLPIL